MNELDFPRIIHFHSSYIAEFKYPQEKNPIFHYAYDVPGKFRTIKTLCGLERSLDDDALEEFATPPSSYRQADYRVCKHCLEVLKDDQA